MASASALRIREAYIYSFSFVLAGLLLDFSTENVNNIVHDTHCQVHLKFEKGDRSIRKSRAICFQLRGTQEATTKAIRSLERSLVATLDPHEKGRALYYMALLNGHRQKNSRNKVVRQYCYHLENEGMKYVYVDRLPGDQKVIAMLIGRGGCNKKRIMKDTHCHIEINTSSSDPHYVAYGNCETNVVECFERIEEIFEARKKF